VFEGKKIAFARVELEQFCARYVAGKSLVRQVMRQFCDVNTIFPYYKSFVCVLEWIFHVVLNFLIATII
jgi:hypothetical protein